MLPAKKALALPAEFNFPASVAASSTRTTSHARTALAAAAGSGNCVFSGKSKRYSQAAHIFPDCWIDDDQATDWVLLKNKNIANTKAKLRQVLNGPANRIMMYASVHLAFDAGDFGLIVVAKGSGRYRIVVKTVTRERHNVDPCILADLATEGVVQNRVVTLPWVDERLIEWHWERFCNFLPTAGANDEDSSSDAEHRRRYRPLEDPHQVQRAREMMCEEAARFLPRVSAH